MNTNTNLNGVKMTEIKTWQERAQKEGDWPIFDGATASKYMKDEITDLRAEIARLQAALAELDAKQGSSLHEGLQGEQTAFLKWWEESAQGTEPRHTLLVRNCAHAAWQARAAIQATRSGEIAASEQEGK